MALSSLKRLSPLLSVAVFLAAGWLLHRELAHYHFHEVRDALGQFPAHKLLAGAALTCLSYVILTIVEWLAVRAANLALPFRKVAMASFVAYTASYNFGPILAGTAMRFRLYSMFGLKATEILTIVLMLGITFWLGVCSVAVPLFVFWPPNKGGIGNSFIPYQLVSLLLTGAIGAYLLLNAIRKAPLRVGRWQIPLAGFRITLGQIAAGSFDLIVVAGVMWALLPDELHVAFPRLITGLLLAILATSFSHVPAGLGIIEFVVLSYVVEEKSPAAVAALVAFRLIYYVAPLLVASTAYFLYEWRANRVALAKLRDTIAKWGAPVTPALLALLTFLSGLMLLLSGATPPVPARLAQLQRLLPISVLETSHLVGSLVGTLLLVLSRGLARRFDSAWLVACGLVAVGIGTSLLKGLDWEEALFLGIVLGLLIAARMQFYRRGALLHAPLSGPWLAAMFVAVSAAIWLGMFAHKHVEYSHDLWWQVAYRADAPRFLRASLVSMITLLVAATISLYRGAPAKHVTPNSDDLATAANIIAHQSSTEALLALVGDKTLLFDDDRSAFLMYARQGRSWIVLGDPVGPEAESTSLVWDFHELADTHGGLTVFYHIPATSLPTYLQIGLTPIKVGDFGRVLLDDFSYEGPKFKELRQVRHRYDRAGFVFEIVAREDVPSLLQRHAPYSCTHFKNPFLVSWPGTTALSGLHVTPFASRCNGRWNSTNGLLGHQESQAAFQFCRMHVPSGFVPLDLRAAPRIDQ